MASNSRSGIATFPDPGRSRRPVTTGSRRPAERLCQDARPVRVTSSDHAASLDWAIAATHDFHAVATGPDRSWFASSSTPPAPRIEDRFLLLGRRRLESRDPDAIRTCCRRWPMDFDPGWVFQSRNRHDDPVVRCPRASVTPALMCLSTRSDDHPVFDTPNYEFYRSAEINAAIRQLQPHILIDIDVPGRASRTSVRPSSPSRPSEGNRAWERA